MHAIQSLMRSPLSPANAAGVDVILSLIWGIYGTQAIQQWRIAPVWKHHKHCNDTQSSAGRRHSVSLAGSWRLVSTHAGQDRRVRDCPGNGEIQRLADDHASAGGNAGDIVQRRRPRRAANDGRGGPIYSRFNCRIVVGGGQSAGARASHGWIAGAWRRCVLAIEQVGYIVASLCARHHVEPCRAELERRQAAIRNRQCGSGQSGDRVLRRQRDFLGGIADLSRIHDAGWRHDRADRLGLVLWAANLAHHVCSAVRAHWHDIRSRRWEHDIQCARHAGPRACWPRQYGRDSSISARLHHQRIDAWRSRGHRDGHTSSAQIPAHTHPINDPGHTHQYTYYSGGGGSGSFGVGDNGTNFPPGTTDTSTTGITVGNNTGGGSAHSNLQPSMVLNWIIKT